MKRLILASLSVIALSAILAPAAARADVFLQDSSESTSLALPGRQPDEDVTPGQSNKLSERQRDERSQTLNNKLSERQRDEFTSGQGNKLSERQRDEFVAGQGNQLSDRQRDEFTSGQGNQLSERNRNEVSTEL